MRAGWLPLLALLAGGFGCAEYRYYDVHVKFAAGATEFDAVSAFTIQSCSVIVSGADNFVIQTLDNCPNHKLNAPDKLDVGTFEYSSLSDSGMLTFTVKAYDDSQTEACQDGQGAVTVPITAMITTKADLTIMRTGQGCKP